MKHQWDLLFKSSWITLEEKSWITVQEAKGKSTPTRVSGPKQAGCGAEILLPQLSFSTARPSSHRNKRLWQKFHIAPRLKGSEMNKGAHVAFSRSAPHWEASDRHWEFFAMAKPAHTILSCGTGQGLPLDRAHRSLHSTTGPLESSGKASSAERSLQKATNITLFHGKPHTKNLRERDMGWHPDNQHIL